MQRDARAADLSGNQISSAEYNDRIDRPDLIAHTIAKVDAAVSRLAQIQSSLRRRHCTPSPYPLTSPATDLPNHHPHALVSPQFHAEIPSDRGLHTAVLNLNQPQKKYYAPAPFLLNPRFSPPPSTIGVADGGGRISKIRRRWTRPEETVIVSGQSTQSSTATTVDADSDKFGGDGKENIDARSQTTRSVKQKTKQQKKISQENNDRIVSRIKSQDAFQKDDKPVSSSHITDPHEAPKPSAGISKTTKASVQQQTYLNDGRAILENKAVNVSATTKEACSSWNASDFQQLPIRYRLQKDVTTAADGNDHGEEHHRPRDGELSANVRPETAAAMVRPKPAQKNSCTGKGMKITTEPQKRPNLPKPSGPKLRSRNVVVADQEGFPQKLDKLDSSCAERLQVMQRSILPGASLSHNIQDAEEIAALKPSSVKRETDRKIGMEKVAEMFPWQMNHQADSAVQRQQSSSASPAPVSTSISDRTNTTKDTSNHRRKSSTKTAVVNTPDHQKYRPPWRSITMISNKRSITTMTIAERVMSAVTHHKSTQIVRTNHAVTMEKSKPQKKIMSKKTASKKKKKTSTDEEKDGVLEEEKKPSKMEDVLAMVRMRSKRIPFSKRAERAVATACNRAVEGTTISRSEYHQRHDQKFVGTAFCVDVIPSPNRPWRLSSKSSSSAKPLVMFPNPAFKASNLYNHPEYGAHVDPGSSRKLDIMKNSCTSSTPFKIFQLPPLIKTSKTNISDRAGDDHEPAENSSSCSSNNNSDNISIIFSVSTNQSTSPSANCDSSGSSIARQCKINSENICKKMITVKKEKSRLSKHQTVPSSAAHSNDHLTSSSSGHSLMKRLSLLLWRRGEIVEATSLPTLITRLPRRRVIDNMQLSIAHDSLSNVRQHPDNLCTTTLPSKSSIAIARTCNMADSTNSTPLPLPPSLRGNITMQAAISSDHAHPSPSMIDKGEKETQYNMNRSLSNCEQIQVEEGTSYSLTLNSIDEPKERESLIDVDKNDGKKKETTKSKEHSLQTCFWWRNGSRKKKKMMMMMNKTRSDKKLSSIWPYR